MIDFEPIRKKLKRDKKHGLLNHVAYVNKVTERTLYNLIKGGVPSLQTYMKLEKHYEKEDK